MLLQGARSTAGGGTVPPLVADPDRGGGRGPVAFDPTRFGLLAFLGTVSMLFIGFTSALMLRRTSGDWQALQAPALLWANTLALGLSSLALELGRRRLRHGNLAGARLLVNATALLGLLFVAGQFLAWRSLAAQGIYLASHPSSSFFYLLTGVHLVHLAGGLVWLAAMAVKVWRLVAPPHGDALALVALYWHFLGALWIYLLLVLLAL